MHKDDTPTPAPVDLAQAFAVFTEINILAQLSATLLEARLPRGMVTAQFGVLNHLAKRREGRTPLQIARAFQVPKTSMTHSLAVLEREGLVEMLRNPDDGRSKIVRITSEGMALRAQMMTALAPDIDSALSGAAPQTLEQVLPLLRELRRVMDAARDG